MEPANILTALRKFVDRIPNANNFSANSDDLQIVGQAIAALKAYKTDFSFSHNLDFIQQQLGSRMMDQGAITQLLTIIHSAIADIEHSMPQEIQGSYGPGATYDFYINFKNLVALAQSTIMLVDPYLNDEVFELYVSKIKAGVNIRILTNQTKFPKFPNNLITVIGKYKQQYGSALEVRDSKELHDRVVFIDTDQCWVLGQSIKDAAKSNPTYLAPLPVEIVNDKLLFYEKIWSTATPI